jgi:hypothetical protein
LRNDLLEKGHIMRGAVFLGGLGVLALAHLAGGAPVEPFAEKQGFRNLAFEPFKSQTLTVECRARERTSAILYGQGTSPMAIYVFDKHGNCVARDDVSYYVVSDDAAVEWYPPTQDVYEVEIHNLGRRQNNAEIVIR